MESITIMVMGWGLMILAIPLTIYLFISTSDDWKQLFITILGALPPPPPPPGPAPGPV